MEETTHKVEGGDADGSKHHAERDDLRYDGVMLRMVMMVLGRCRLTKEEEPLVADPNIFAVTHDVVKREAVGPLFPLQD